MPPACRAQALRVWSPAVPFCDIHPPCRQPDRATRAYLSPRQGAIKALSTHPSHPRPYRSKDAGLDASLVSTNSRTPAETTTAATTTTTASSATSTGTAASSHSDDDYFTVLKIGAQHFVIRSIG